MTNWKFEHCELAFVTFGQEQLGVNDKPGQSVIVADRKKESEIKLRQKL